MRILMISDVYFPRVNGVSTSVMTFRRELVARGHEVTLIAPDYGVPCAEEEGIIRIRSRRLPFDPEDRMMRAREITRLGPRLAAEDYDLIHIQTPFVAHYLGLSLGRRLGIPCVATYHTFFEEYLYHYLPFLPKGGLRWLARRFSARQCNQLHSIVVPSSAMLEVLRGYGVRTPAAVIPTGIELEAFAQGDGAGFRRRHGIAAERPTLLYVGRVAFEKNIGFLLAVLEQVRRELPAVLLLIVGEGPARAQLEQEVVRRGLDGNVQFLGYLDRRQALQDCYRAGDVLVFASRTETQGLVPLEAMALGVPVVSTAVMGTRDIIQPHSGGLRADETVVDFSAKVLRVLNDLQLSRQLGSAGRRYVHEWSAGAMAERMLAYYREVGGVRWAQGVDEVSESA